MSGITPELVADELKHQLMPALCEQRAELWRNTEGGTSLLAQEARCRANEATYIAALCTEAES